MNVIYKTTHLSLIYDYSYIRLGEPWGCLTSLNVRLEWRSHFTGLSIKLHEQMSSSCGETWIWTRCRIRELKIENFSENTAPILTYYLIWYEHGFKLYDVACTQNINMLKYRWLPELGTMSHVIDASSESTSLCFINFSLITNIIFCFLSSCLLALL